MIPMTPANPQHVEAIFSVSPHGEEVVVPVVGWSGDHPAVIQGQAVVLAINATKLGTFKGLRVVKDDYMQQVQVAMQGMMEQVGRLMAESDEKHAEAVRAMMSKLDELQARVHQAESRGPLAS